MNMLMDSIDQPPFHVKENASTLTLKPMSIFTTTTRDDSHSRQFQPTRQIKKNPATIYCYSCFPRYR